MSDNIFKGHADTVGGSLFLSLVIVMGVIIYFIFTGSCSQYLHEQELQKKRNLEWLASDRRDSIKSDYKKMSQLEKEIEWAIRDYKERPEYNTREDTIKEIEKIKLKIEDCLKFIAWNEKDLEDLLTDLGKPSNYTYIEWDRKEGYDDWDEFDESGGRIHKD